MLLAPSPRNTRVSPASLPRRSLVPLQVGEDLTGVELVGERVDDRDGRRRGHGLDAGVPKGPPDDRVDVAGQHPRGVLDGLLAAKLHGAAVHDDRVSAELADADVEGEPGAGGVLLEDRGDGLARQRFVAERVGFEFGGEVETSPVRPG